MKRPMIAILVVVLGAVAVLVKHGQANAAKRAAIEAANAARQAARAQADTADTFSVTFAPRAPFKPVTAMGLLDAFNEKHPPGGRLVLGQRGGTRRAAAWTSTSGTQSATGRSPKQPHMPAHSSRE